MEVLYSQLVPDWDQMSQLMSLGFSETEARLGLRACQGDLQRAAELITTQREVTLTHASIPVDRDSRDTTSFTESLTHFLSLLFLVLQEREELRRKERSRRSSNRRRKRREELLSSSLQQLGFSPREASEAAKLAQGDLDRACGVSGSQHRHMVALLLSLF